MTTSSQFYSFTIVVLVLMRYRVLSALALHPRKTTTSTTSRYCNSVTRMSMCPIDTTFPYQPPAWAEGRLKNEPKHGRLHLANLPTPIHRIGRANNSKNKASDKDESSGSAGGILSWLQELNITVYIKRDDATGGVELGGNKVRKLEFLLADALAKGCDSVVTIGGEQSNHCRATAAASRMVGLSPHLILRTSRADAIQDKKEELGWTGNIMFDRMVGSTIYTCTPREYGQLGSNALVSKVCEYITHSKETPNKHPYAIPVGGSNALGTWGYINAVDELVHQIDDLHASHSAGSGFTLDHVVFATGSGGTATGIVVGLSLAYGNLDLGVVGHPKKMKDKSAPKVHAVGVCDDPEYFYQTITSIADEMGIDLPLSLTTEQFIREAVTIYNGKGRGYAFSSDEELNFIVQFAIETGVVLDSVYSGKALYYFFEKIVKGDPNTFRNKNILFWNTGGSIGLYEKADSLMEKMVLTSPVKRMDISSVSSSKE